MRLGDPLKVTMDDVAEGVPLQQTIGELSQHVAAMSSYLSVRFHIYTLTHAISKYEM